MVSLEHYWMRNDEWIHYENGRLVLNDDAPEEAKERYRTYLNQLEAIDRRTTRTLIIPKNQAGIDDYEDNDVDWSLGDYETDILRVFNIPYDEFCIIRENLPLEDYLAEDSYRMYDTEIEHYLSLLKEKQLNVPFLFSILEDALNYHTFVEYVESNLL